MKIGTIASLDCFNAPTLKPCVRKLTHLPSLFKWHFFLAKQNSNRDKTHKTWSIYKIFSSDSTTCQIIACAIQSLVDNKMQNIFFKIQPFCCAICFFLSRRLNVTDKHD